jgi:hypothetical protein
MGENEHPRIVSTVKIVRGESLDDEIDRAVDSM